MNIVLISRFFYPHIGGVERHVLFLSQELISQGHNVTVITEQYDSNLLSSETYKQVRIIRIPTHKTGEWFKKFVIWRWILNNQSLFLAADVIHVHDVVFWLYPFKLLHPFKKIYSTFHGWEGIYPIPIKNIIKKRLDAFLSYKNICIGTYITRWYGIKATDISFGATSAPTFNKTKSNKKLTLLYIGRLDSDSCIEACLKLYKKLKPSLHWQMMVIGDGPLKHKIPPEVNFLGFVSNPHKYIANADYVFTTGYLSLLEAFIHRKIVFSSYNNPLQKDYLTSHPMAKSIIIDDNVISQGVQKAYVWSITQTWTKLTSQYLTLWQ